MTPSKLSNVDQAKELYSLIEQDPIYDGVRERFRYPLCGPGVISDLPFRIKEHFPIPADNAATVHHRISSSIERDPPISGTAKTIGTIATASFRQFESVSTVRFDISTLHYKVIADGMGHFGIERHFNTELGGAARSALEIEDDKAFDDFISNAPPALILIWAEETVKNAQNARMLGLATNIFDVDIEEAQQVLEFHRNY